MYAKQKDLVSIVRYPDNYFVKPTELFKESGWWMLFQIHVLIILSLPLLHHEHGAP
jgi:hypothetical protein